MILESVEIEIFGENRKNIFSDIGLGRWSLRPYSATGGTCLAGESDLYIDCIGDLSHGNGL